MKLILFLSILLLPGCAYVEYEAAKVEAYQMEMMR